MSSSRTLGSVAACALLALGCANIGPTAELVEARSAYEQARTGDAGARVPHKVYEAKKALGAAERQHDRDPGSTKEADLAYIAHRKALEAMAMAKQDVARDRIAQAQKAQETVLTAQRDAANERLARLMRAQKAGQIRVSLSGAVLFKFNEADLLPTARQKLDEVAAALKEQPDGAKITVEGHTDAMGSDAYNAGLSQRRAESVREYLVSKGVAPDRIRAEGKGESHPIAKNDSPEGRANNRRVEIVLGEPASGGMEKKQPEMRQPEMQQPSGMKPGAKQPTK